jgi:hypothetical protein
MPVIKFLLPAFSKNFDMGIVKSIYGENTSIKYLNISEQKLPATENVSTVINAKLIPLYPHKNQHVVRHLFKKRLERFIYKCKDNFKD